MGRRLRCFDKTWKNRCWKICGPQNSQRGSCSHFLQQLLEVAWTHQFYKTMAPCCFSLGWHLVTCSSCLVWIAFVDVTLKKMEHVIRLLWKMDASLQDGFWNPGLFDWLSPLAKLHFGSLAGFDAKWFRPPKLAVENQRFTLYSSNILWDAIAWSWSHNRWIIVSKHTCPWPNPFWASIPSKKKTWKLFFFPTWLNSYQTWSSLFLMFGKVWTS